MDAFQIRAANQSTLPPRFRFCPVQQAPRPSGPQERSQWLPSGPQERRHWLGLSPLQRAERWRRALPVLGIDCPKIRMSHIYYPDLGRRLRGAVAAEPIGASEVFCRLPVAALLSQFSVGNSSLRGLMDTYCDECHAASQRRTAQQPSVSLTAILAVFALREGARRASRSMPHLHAILAPDESTDGNPASWPQEERDSPRQQAAGAYAGALAAVKRATIAREYASLFPSAFRQHARELGEGVGCAHDGSGHTGAAQPCSVAQLVQQVYSLPRFARIYLQLQSRGFHGRLYGAHRPYVAPLLDLFNYGDVGVGVVIGVDEARHELVAMATRPIEQGRELLFDYGELGCREAALVSHGFAPVSARPCTAAQAAAEAESIRSGEGRRTVFLKEHE